MRGTGDPAEVVRIQLQRAKSNERKEHHGRPLLGRRKAIYLGVDKVIGPRDWPLSTGRSLGLVFGAAIFATGV
jgi:hypothetical protein